MNELLSTRLIALSLLFTLTLCAGLGPVILFRLWNRRKQSTILDVSGSGRKTSTKLTKSTASAVTLQIFMFFGGGVLLATCFVHLIPEVRENFDIYYHSQENEEGSSNNIPRSDHGHLHVHHFGGDGSSLNGGEDNHHHHHHHHHNGKSNINHTDHSHLHHDDNDEHDHSHHHHRSSNNNSSHSHDHIHGDDSNAMAEKYINTLNNGSTHDSLKSSSSSSDSDESESAESVPYRLGHTHKHKIPYVELAICGGFFLIYFLEELIHMIIGHDHHEREEDDADKDAPIIVSVGDYKSNQRTPSVTISNGKFDTSSHKSASYGPAELVSCNKIINTSTYGYDNPGVDLRGEMCLGKFSAPIDALSNSSTISPTHSYDKLKMSYSVPTSVKFLRGLVTIIAFSAHSVFDGVAIGLQKTTSQLWTIFFAIFLHKLVVSFAIGLELNEKCESFALTTIHMILFSIMSPIGILLVIITEREFSERESPIMILLSAVATGTILYIVFFEVLQKDRTSKLPGLIEFFFLVAGFACMSCLTLFVDH